MTCTPHFLGAAAARDVGGTLITDCNTASEDLYRSANVMALHRYFLSDFSVPDKSILVVTTDHRFYGGSGALVLLCSSLEYIRGMVTSAANSLKSKLQNFRSVRVLKVRKNLCPLNFPLCGKSLVRSLLEYPSPVWFLHKNVCLHGFHFISFHLCFTVQRQ